MKFPSFIALIYVFIVYVCEPQHEASKLELSRDMIQRYMMDHIEWLESNEGELFAILNQIVTDRFNREISAGNLLINIILGHISDAEQLPPFWLVTADAVPPVEPELVWDKYRSQLPSSMIAKYETQEGMEHYLVVKSRRQSQVSRNSITDYTRNMTSLFGTSRQSVSRGDMDLSHLRLFTPSMLPSASQEQVFAKNRDRYESQRSELEQRLMKVRDERELEFIGLGMTPSMAKLAAFNDLVLEEQNQLSDLDSQFKARRDALQVGMERRSRPASSGENV